MGPLELSASLTLAQSSFTPTYTWTINGVRYGTFVKRHVITDLVPAQAFNISDANANANADGPVPISMAVSDSNRPAAGVARRRALRSPSKTPA